MLWQEKKREYSTLNSGWGRLVASEIPLLSLQAVSDWEFFRHILNKGFKKAEEAQGPGGRPPFDYVVRFRVLILQSLYNLSDDAMEYQLNDRRTFQRFVDLDGNDSIPDAKTIWAWREQLVKNNVSRKFFERFWKYLDKADIKANFGSIIDVLFFDKPRQRNTKDENDTIKKGEIPEDWKKPENVDKLRHKDTNTRWTKKNNETHYGYKNHVMVYKNTKFIKKSVVTDALVHDSQAFCEFRW